MPTQKAYGTGNLVRITGGTLRSRTIKAPKGTSTRPTSDRVREALFSILQGYLDLQDTSVLDLYAGSGALALECLSRGAAAAYAVESARDAIACIRENAVELRLDKQLVVLPQKVESVPTWFAKHQPQIDLLLADPPYAEIDSGAALNAIAACVHVCEPACVVIEHSSKTSETVFLGQQWHGWQRTVRLYGDTALTFLHQG
jgi:16S rRNA (guanine966-N2)-methyltransferase